MEQIADIKAQTPSTDAASTQLSNILTATDDGEPVATTSAQSTGNNYLARDVAVTKTTVEDIQRESVACLGSPVSSNKSTDSIQSSNEFGNSCRICRWNRSDMQVLAAPCHCKGSVGYIHLQCLRRWILHRRDNTCEICHAPFNLPEEKISFRRMLHSFFYYRCCGSILKQFLFGASLLPLAHIVLQQMLICMEKINQSDNEQLTVQEVLIASCTLLTSSALFFNFFEFFATRFLIIRNILGQWWMFGSSNEFSIVDVDSEMLDVM